MLLDVHRTMKLRENRIVACVILRINKKKETKKLNQTIEH